MLAGASELDIEVGDVLCVMAGTGPTGEPVITDVDADGDGVPDGADDGDAPALPDTATPAPVEFIGLAVALVAILIALAGNLQLGIVGPKR